MGAILEINKRITMFMKVDKYWEDAKPVVKFGAKKSAMHSFCLREITELRRVKQQIIRMMFLLCIVLSTSCAVESDLFRPTAGSMITWVGEDYIYTGTYTEPKKDSIPNYWGSSYCVGDIVFKEY